MDPKQEALEQARADHAQLSELITRINDTSDLRELAPLLGEFQSTLMQHFELEEGDEGLFKSVVNKAPRLQVRVDDCREEHTAFLATAVDLRKRAEACLALKAAILSEMGQLLDELREHEGVEARLLSDSVCTDLGAGD